MGRYTYLMNLDPQEFQRLMDEEGLDYPDEEFWPCADIAKIPPGNVSEFLVEVHDHVFAFETQTQLDRFRRQRNITINEFVKAAGRMISATEQMQEYLKTGAAPRKSSIHWIEHHRLFQHETLDSLKRALADTLKDAKAFSVSELPGGGKKIRQKKLIAHIWQMAEKCGGSLTYNKHDGRGTLTNIFALLGRWMPSFAWKDVSPSTIERLRPKKKLLGQNR